MFYKYLVFNNNIFLVIIIIYLDILPLHLIYNFYNFLISVKFTLKKNASRVL